MNVSWTSDWLSSPSVWATYRLKATKLSDYGRTLQIEPQQIKGTPMEPKYRYFSCCLPDAYYRADANNPKAPAVFFSPRFTGGTCQPNAPTLVGLLDGVIAEERKEITKEAAEALVKPKVPLKVGQWWQNDIGTYVLTKIDGFFYLVEITSGGQWSSRASRIEDVFGTPYPTGFELVKDV